MKCPFCAALDTSVKDSRDTEKNLVIRRRRYCHKCHGRFTTFERIQLRELFVIKRSGAKRIFDRNKVEHSINMAIRKRDVTNEAVATIIDKVILKLENSHTAEISTRKISEIIMKEFAKIDHVAYIRFASCYKDFNNARDFAIFITNTLKPIH